MRYRRPAEGWGVTEDHLEGASLHLQAYGCNQDCTPETTSCAPRHSKEVCEVEFRPCSLAFWEWNLLKCITAAYAGLPWFTQGAEGIAAEYFGACDVLHRLILQHDAG